MARYDSDRTLRLEPFDWDGYITRHKLGKGLRRRYRIIPLDLPITAEEFEVLREGSIADLMSDKWDITFVDNMLVFTYTWTAVVTYLLRVVRHGDGYRICDMLENANPHYWNADENEPGKASGWAVWQIASLLGGYRFEWQDEWEWEEWSWYSPPKKARSKIRRMASRKPSIRSAFQRSVLGFFADFDTWFRIPFKLVRRTRDTWRIRLEGLNVPIEAVFIAHSRHHYQLLVEVKLEDGLRIPLASLVCSPEHYEKWRPYRCRIEAAEGKDKYSESLVELWHCCLHGRFLDWVNGRLAHSRWIVVDMSKAKYSAALAEERPEDRPGQRVIALRGDCENAKLVTHAQ